jgi:5-methylcytosine-specific restriction endonuclease McrA
MTPKEKRYQQVKAWRHNTKLKLDEGFDSKCTACGLQDEPIVYDFHHLHSEEKEFQLSSKIMSWENIVTEAKKCIMLCSHCHRKVHSGSIKLNDMIVFDETRIKSQKNNRWGFKQ